MTTTKKKRGPQPPIAVQQDIKAMFLRVPVTLSEKIAWLAKHERRSKHMMTLMLVEEALVRRMEEMPIGDFPFLDMNVVSEFDPELPVLPRREKNTGRKLR